jgi:mono/diheme cytochrome c family protein
MRYSLTVLMGLALSGTALSALAADAAAGKAKVAQSCADCHDPADWKGQSEVQLRAKISDVVAGKAKHKKKIQLTDEEISNIAAYWATAGK